MKRFLALLDKVIGDSKTLSRLEPNDNEIIFGKERETWSNTRI
jgi:hypothetical protein